ncbi:MAG: DUF917 domain-containing protein [Pseudomonadota bacterium]
MTEIGADDVEDLVLGSVFLATGGGGDPYLPELIAKQALTQNGPATLIDPDSLDDDAFVVTIGSVGAPTCSLELLPSIDEASETLAAYEAHIGRKVDAIASFEIGGANSLIPLVAAAGRDLPVINGDGMGRALPEAQMMSFSIEGIKATPSLARDYLGNISTFVTGDTTTYERHIRAYTAAAGGMVTAVENPMSGADLKRSIIPRTFSFARALGQTIRENRGIAEDLLAPLKSVFEGSIYGEIRLIHMGKVTDKSTRIIGGYDIGEAQIASFDPSGQSLTLSIKNEYLLARSDSGEVLASVPDLITLVDYETSQPINAERLRYGQRVAVFAMGCPALYRTPAALEVVAPRCFGFDVDYVPLEQLGEGLF